MQARTIDVQGIPMRWIEEGEGFPVVLVHGIPTSPHLWRHVLPALHGARGLAWEMVGYGGSIPAAVRPDGGERDISVARQSEYLLDWLDAVGVERAVFVGHDLGGGVVQLAAARQPERCAGLVLTNSIGYDSWPIPSVKAVRAGGALVERLPLGAFRAMLHAFVGRGHEDSRLAEESFDAHWPAYAAHGGAAAFVRQVRSLDVHDTLGLDERLRSLRGLPSRVVWGAADGFQKLRYGERLARDLDAPIHRIARGRHFTPEDHPREVGRAIDAVVRELSRAPARSMR